MNLENCIISFKSELEFFLKEQSGIKPNTVRNVDFKDERFRKLLAMEQSQALGIIRIRKKGSLDSFDRKIKDISFFKNLVVISWEVV